MDMRLVLVPNQELAMAWFDRRKIPVSIGGNGYHTYKLCKGKDEPQSRNDETEFLNKLLTRF